MPLRVDVLKKKKKGAPTMVGAPFFLFAKLNCTLREG